MNPVMNVTANLQEIRRLWRKNPNHKPFPTGLSAVVELESYIQAALGEAGIGVRSLARRSAKPIHAPEEIEACLDIVGRAASLLVLLAQPERTH